MLGLMQEWPLLCHKILDYAASQHGAREVVSRSIEGPITRTTYAQIRARSLRLAQRLEREGFGLGDRVATLAWNSDRHIEAWYGIMGIGAIYHTLNPRLFPEQTYLDHEPRAGQAGLHRPDLLAPARKDRPGRKVAGKSGRPHRCSAHALDFSCQCRAL